MLFEQYLTHKSQNIQKCAWVEGLHNGCHLTSSHGKVDGAGLALALQSPFERALTYELGVIGQQKVFRHMERIRINESELAKMFCEIDQPIRHRLARRWWMITIDPCLHIVLKVPSHGARNLMFFIMYNLIRRVCADKHTAFCHCAHS